MNILISPYAGNCQWCEDFFPHRSLCSLPVTGKALALHMLDWASLLSAQHVLILDYAYTTGFAAEITAHRHQWTPSIDYCGASLATSLKQLTERHAAFLAQSEETLIVSGPIFPCTADPGSLCADAHPCNAGDAILPGFFLYRRGQLHRCPLPFIRYDGLRQYFELNFTLLERPGWWIIPGYSVQNGVYTGMDVSIKPGCEITTPVMLGDGIRIERGCTLRGGAVVGDGSLIDFRTVLDHAVVMPHTFIGNRMEFCGKIIDGDRIIDPVRAVYVDQDEIGISSQMQDLHPPRLCSAFEFLLMLFLALAGLPVFVTAWLCGSHFRRSVGWQWLSLDRYMRLWDTLLHNGHLIRRRQGETHYVICASEGFGTADTLQQQHIDDLYYRHHRSITMVLRLVCNSLILRFCNPPLPRP